MKLRKDRQEARRQEAIVRNAKWNAMSTESKIHDLKTRRGNCTKQLARLGVQ